MGKLTASESDEFATNQAASATAHMMPATIPEKEINEYTIHFRK